MNSTLKRVLGVTGSVALGIAGALTFASAAQAHHVEIVGTATCADDGWTVTWETTDWDSQNVGAGVIETITSNGELSGDIVEGAELPHPSTGDKLIGTQALGFDETVASIQIDAVWPNGHTGTGVAELPQPEGGCDEPVDPAPVVDVGASSDCFGLEILVTNQDAERTVEIGLQDSQNEYGDWYYYEVAPGDTLTEYFANDPELGDLAVAVTVDGEDHGTFEWDGGTNCEWGYVTDTCEGLDLELTIPEDGLETTYTFNPSNSDEETVVTVAPGGTEPVSFAAGDDEEFSVDYIIDDGKSFYEDTLTWTKPADCEEVPTESESPSAAPTLPTTGSSMTIMISAAAALVLAAAVLFMIARRRKAAGNW
ncbi:LPXTG cell wall anchor domain-containing protein [Glycomyces buryatensis]|uniref:LPXTG cell wall anchor domain-containing protein n=1 Tax=Glycomyces buryatensis TaxID=2570927 RepID=A0A4S8QFR3_9ACTN|nr:LPXTG cell wall anchor domain-containing protein [Glycomyces buryatensis]THV39474.1 LPXTG cell wall anchor domain-containing protein [Glycomyces buryatensis]